jgi:hypothetical protein
VRPHDHSGHATRQSLEIHSHLAIADAQQRYDDVIGDFPGLTLKITLACGCTQERLSRSVRVRRLDHPHNDD